MDLGTSAAAKVELTAEKLSIPASLASATDITVTVTDASGNAVKRETVNLSTDKGTIQTPAANNGDGTYTATYAAVDGFSPSKSNVNKDDLTILDLYFGYLGGYPLILLNILI